MNPLPYGLCFDTITRHTGRCPYDTANVDGTVKWKLKLSNLYCSSPAIGKDGTLYVVSTYNHDYVDTGVLYAITQDGKIKWQFKLAYSRFESFPAIAPDGTIYVGVDDYYLYAISPNGRLKWKFRTGDFMIISSPAIAGNGTIYFAGLDAFYALNPNGRLVWKIKELGGSGSPSIGKDGIIYQGGSTKDTDQSVGKFFFCAVTQDGKIKWQFEVGSWAGDSAISKEGTIYFIFHDGYLYALNPDGTLKWKYEVGWGSPPTPSISPDGTLYVGTNNGLYAFGNK